jgi:hypothetical protein
LSAIKDFTTSELWITKTTLEERYGEATEPSLADTELRMNAYATELTPCPAAYQEHQGRHFIICKTGVTQTTAASSITAYTRCKAPALKNTTTCQSAS